MARRVANTWPWNIKSSTLGIIVACVVVTFVLTVCIARAGPDDRKLIANWVSLGGAALTFAGLSWAYMRTVHADDKMRAWIRRLKGLPPPTQNVYLEGIPSSEAFGTLRVPYQFNGTEDRAEHLKFLNNLSATVAATQSRITEVDQAVKQARAETRDGDQDTRIKADEALRTSPISSRNRRSWTSDTPLLACSFRDSVQS